MIEDENGAGLHLDSPIRWSHERGPPLFGQAALIAIGVDWAGRRNVLGVELANRESGSGWKEFLPGLERRRLHGVAVVVSDDHPGLERAIAEVLPAAARRRCYVHFLQNALDYVARKLDDDCLEKLRWFDDRRERAAVRRDPARWPGKWQTRSPRLCDRVEANIEETLTHYQLPLAHHEHMKSTKILERPNQELERRTQVVRILPNIASSLRFIRALPVETHENRLKAIRYLNTAHRIGHEKGTLRRLDEAAAA